MILSFLGESHLYSYNREIGCWMFDEDKAVEETFQSMVNPDMPNWFVAGVRHYYRQETLVL